MKWNLQKSNYTTVVDDEGCCIATVNWTSSRPYDAEKFYANAKLIAAAPILLEALEKIASFAPGNGDVCEIIAKISRKAIEKATK